MSFESPYDRQPLKRRFSQLRSASSGVSDAKCIASDDTLTMRAGALARMRSSRRFVSRKCPRWLIPKWASKPSPVSRRTWQHDARVVDEQVDRPVAREEAAGEGPHGCQRGQIERRRHEAVRIDAPLARCYDPPPRRLRLREIATRHRHVGAAQRQHSRRLEADAAAGAGDDRVPAAEVDALAHLLGGGTATEFRALPAVDGSILLIPPAPSRSSILQ